MSDLFSEIATRAKDLRHRVMGMESQDCRQELADVCELLGRIAGELARVEKAMRDRPTSDLLSRWSDDLAVEKRTLD